MASDAHLDGVGAPASTVGNRWQTWSASRRRSFVHRHGVAALTRAVPASRRDAALRIFREQLHRGDRVECPICEKQYRHFAARWNTVDVVCWCCGSHERHRALWLVLDRLRPDLLGTTQALLHFAPEPGIAGRLERRVPRYVTADLEPGRADLALDITSLDLDDASFDAVICSHVLEHVPDDAAAMRELHRILRPGGWAIVMVPVDHDRARTLEDPGIADPVERRRMFWQEDHVRLYALDIVDRLRRARFEVDHVRPTDELTQGESERWRLGLGSDVFICRATPPA
jgi:hypothetical protein